MTKLYLDESFMAHHLLIALNNLVSTTRLDLGRGTHVGLEQDSEICEPRQRSGIPFFTDPTNTMGRWTYHA